MIIIALLKICHVSDVYEFPLTTFEINKSLRPKEVKLPNGSQKLNMKILKKGSEKLKLQ